VLADPSFRRALTREMGEPGVPNRISNANWDYLTIAEAKKPEHQHLEGKTIGELARAQKREPFDVFLDFGLADDLETMFDCRLFNTDEKKVSERGRISPSSATRASVFISSGTGCASGATSRSSRRCAR
jgi:N-acyl-D-aspartate/D-glutamate deacylase